MSSKIIVAGAGFAGVRVASDLSRLLPQAKITLINTTPYHCFNPNLYEVATAVLQKERKIDFQNLKCSAAIPLTQIFKGKNIQILVDKIVEVDPDKNLLVTKNLGKLDYDFLVLSLGSETNDFGIAGAKGFGHPLKNVEDALNIRNDFEELIFQNNRSVSVAIAGGGFTGVELAGELEGFLKKIALAHHKPLGKITVLEASPTLLCGMPSWAQEKALNRLQKLGIEVKLNFPIDKVAEGKIYSKQQIVDFDYLVWTAGIKGCLEQKQIPGVSLTKKSQLQVLGDLSLEKYPNIFVIGDLAEIFDHKRNCPVASTASSAVSQGSLAAKNIQSKILGRCTKDFVPKGAVFIVPIGSRFAMTNVFDLKIFGLSAWVLKSLVTLKYLISILPFFQALLIWKKGVEIYTAND
ncbi:MAG: NAD(P)/FAD-dependent oxidoreductase [Patescibacteria group bacterium]|nr:NAD(P)/FAD-dependent oxidoreductase [Patescibacteria group bacterium]